MSDLAPYLGIAAALVAAMTGAWALTLRPGRSGWIDVIWSFAPWPRRPASRL